MAKVKQKNLGIDLDYNHKKIMEKLKQGSKETFYFSVFRASSIICNNLLKRKL